MRRLFSLLIACTLSFAIGGSIISPATLAQTPVDPSQPAAEWQDPVFLGSLTLPNPDGSKSVLVSSKLTMGLGVSTPGEPHVHAGAFLLAVESGGVCYSVQQIIGDTVVTAMIPAPVAAPAGCTEATDLACETDNLGTRTCTLIANQTIYLPEFSTISHTGNARHAYKNVDASIPAVLYLSTLMPDTEDAGCAGGCY